MQNMTDPKYVEYALLVALNDLCSAVLRNAPIMNDELRNAYFKADQVKQDIEDTFSLTATVQ